MQLNGIEIVDTFAEAFDMTATRFLSQRPNLHGRGGPPRR